MVESNGASALEAAALGPAAGQTLGSVLPLRAGALWGGTLFLLRKGAAMTLLEISLGYQAAAEPLRRRLAQLRREAARETDAEALWRLKRRIAELTPLLTEMNQLAELTARYYERGYYRNARYTL